MFDVCTYLGNICNIVPTYRTTSFTTFSILAYVDETNLTASYVPLEDVLFFLAMKDFSKQERDRANDGDLRFFGATSTG